MPGPLVQGRPTNLHLPEGAHEVPVEGDVYKICERIKEVHPSLHVSLFRDRDGNQAWFIFERNETGDHGLFKVHELDGRVLDRCRRAMDVDVARRAAFLQAEAERYQQEQHDNEVEAMYEDLGQAFWYQLEHDGFIETRPKSYPKRGVSGPRRGAGRPE